MCRHRTVILLAVVLSASGCAFTDVPLTMPTKGAPDTVPGGRGRQIVLVQPFIDERPTKDRCGMQKNGYNMDTADAKCQEDPAAWMARYLGDELRASGFSVLRPEDAHREGALRLEGALLQLFVEPVIGFWSGSLETDLSVRLVATTATGLRAERVFFVKGVKKGVLASTLNPYHTSLNRAAQDAAVAMVRALIELLDRYPQLGWTPLECIDRATGMDVAG